VTATVNLKAIESCAVQHRGIRITIGAQNRVISIHGSELTDPITEADWRNLAVLLLRLHQIGRTFAQLDTLLMAAAGLDTVVS